MSQFPTSVHAPYILRTFAWRAERGTREGNERVCLRRAPAARRHGRVDCATIFRGRCRCETFSISSTDLPCRVVDVTAAR